MLTKTPIANRGDQQRSGVVAKPNRHARAACGDDFSQEPNHV